MRVTIVAILVAAAFAAPAAASSLPAIRTPSGNIRCVYAARTDPRNSGGLFCTIAHADYAARLQAGCAGLDWHGWVVSGNFEPEPDCSGGALWFGTPRYATLAYGQVWRHFGYTCRSARAGLTCTNRAGHGLFVSRASWRSF